MADFSSYKFYREYILDIDLAQNGSLHRTFLNHSIGLGDTMENRFGVRLWRNGEPVNLDMAATQGIFMRADGQNLAIVGSDYTQTSGNVGWVQLPQGCYSVEGQFTLSIKVVDPHITGTMWIIDGTVDNTGADTASNIDPDVPTWEEVLAVWELMQECIYGSVRWDISQANLSASDKLLARTNIESQLDLGLFIDSGGYICQKITGETE